MFSPSDERAPKEDSALARWAADPANTAWMESKYTDLREAGGAVRALILARPRVDAAPGVDVCLPGSAGYSHVPSELHLFP